MKNQYWFSLFGAVALLCAGALGYWLLRPIEPMSERQIYNLAYPLHGYVANFKNGHYEFGDNPSEDGYSRAKIVHYAIGDLDKDGDQDAVAIISDDNGEIGSLIYLATIENAEGTAKVVSDPLILGDQVNIQGLAIEGGHVLVRLLPAEEPNTQAKTVTLRFSLQENQLQEITEEPK